MKNFWVTLLEVHEVCYQVKAEDADEALEKARSGNLTAEEDTYSYELKDDASVEETEE